jgi:hypothetical protein
VQLPLRKADLSDIYRDYIACLIPDFSDLQELFPEGHELSPFLGCCASHYVGKFGQNLVCTASYLQIDTGAHSV